MSSLPDKLRNQVSESLNLETTDKIIKFLQSGAIKLTMKEMEALDRFDVIDNLLRSGKTSTYIARVMKSRYQMSERQTSRDIIDTQVIYGSIRNINKDYYLSFLLESIISSIRLANTEGAAMLKEKNMAEKNLIKLLEMLETKDKGATIKNLIINITSDPESIGLKPIDDLEAKIRKYMRPTKSMDIDAETVSYE